MMEERIQACAGIASPLEAAAAGEEEVRKPEMVEGRAEVYRCWKIPQAYWIRLDRNHNCGPCRSPG